MNGTEPSDSAPPVVVVVGASAGGVTALERLMSLLPADLPAAVLVVLHLNPSGVSVLPEILGRAGSLPSAHATDGEPLRPGSIRVALPDRHLHVADGRIVVDKGPHEHGHRPSIDRLFRSAAHFHGRRAVGVLLSGMLDDGVWGLDHIRRAGGVTIAQDPSDAQFPALPTAAIEAGAAQHILTIESAAIEIERSVRIASADNPGPDHLDEVTHPERPEEPSAYTCPACGGAMHHHGQHDAGELFRCHTGHLYSSTSLSAAQLTRVDEAMWAAYRSLREQASLARRIARRLDATSTRRSRQLRRAEIAERRATVLHDLLTEAVDTTTSDSEPTDDISAEVS